MRDTRKSEYKVNEYIYAPRIQVISNNGDNLGVMSRYDALLRAREEGFDLVLIAETGTFGVPVAKVMDFGKMLYAKKKKLAETKRNQKVIKIKEIKLRPKIEEHDYLTKLNQAIDFLKEGNRVKFTLVFRGREMATKNERGQAMFDKINTTLVSKELGMIEHEQDARIGQLWSRVYLLKNK